MSNLEVFKTISAFPAYCVSNFGTVKRNGRSSPCKQAVLKRGGYMAVSLWKNNKGHTRSVHRLVAEAFIPNPEGKRDVAHADGNAKNNHASNLRWATRSENEADKISHGRTNRGSRNGMSKLRPDDVCRIKSMHDDGKRQQEIAAQFNITQGQVSRIVNDRRWSL